MLDIPWLIVVVGWTVILVTLSLSTLQTHRIGSGLYKEEIKKLSKERWLVKAVVFVYVATSISIAWQIRLPIFDDLKDVSRHYFMLIGGIVYIIAIARYIYARIVLTYEWDEGATRRLVKDGPFKHSRHPLIVSYLFAGLASGLIITDIRVIVFIVLLVPLVVLKAIVDEKHLEYIFPEYNEYKDKTRMFI